MGRKSFKSGAFAFFETARWRPCPLVTLGCPHWRQNYLPAVSSFGSHKKPHVFWRQVLASQYLESWGFLRASREIQQLTWHRGVRLARIFWSFRHVLGFGPDLGPQGTRNVPILGPTRSGGSIRQADPHALSSKDINQRLIVWLRNGKYLLLLYMHVGTSISALRRKQEEIKGHANHEFSESLPQ